MKIPVGNFDVGTLAAGAGLVLLAPMVAPLVAGILKPVTKTAIKGGILVYDRSKAAVAEARESIEDWTAEAKAEIAKISAEAKAEITDESKSSGKKTTSKS